MHIQIVMCRHYDQIWALLLCLPDGFPGLHPIFLCLRCLGQDNTAPLCFVACDGHRLAPQLWMIQDVVSQGEAWQVLLNLSESVGRRLRENGFRARTVELSVRDNKMEWFHCQGKLPTVSCESTSLANEAMKLLREKYRFSRPLRALGRPCL